MPLLKLKDLMIEDLFEASEGREDWRKNLGEIQVTAWITRTDTGKTFTVPFQNDGWEDRELYAYTTDIQEEFLDSDRDRISRNDFDTLSGYADIRNAAQKCFDKYVKEKKEGEKKEEKNWEDAKDEFVSLPVSTLLELE